jgi:DNA-binding MarR family transcriptional regulator
MVDRQIIGIERLKKLRFLLDSTLYSSHSVITYDLILVILQAHYTGRALTMKELCTGSVRSVLNVRQHLEQLEKDGWIVFSNGIHDKRLRIVRATSKLTDLSSKIFDEL